MHIDEKYLEDGLVKDWRSLYRILAGVAHLTSSLIDDEEFLKVTQAALDKPCPWEEE